MAGEGQGGAGMAEVNRLRAQVADLRRQLAECRQRSERQAALAARVEGLRPKARHALLMGDPEYIEDCLRDIYS